jgi:hypothetical protein
MVPVLGDGVLNHALWIALQPGPFSNEGRAPFLSRVKAQTVQQSLYTVLYLSDKIV